MCTLPLRTRAAGQCDGAAGRRQIGSAERDERIAARHQLERIVADLALDVVHHSRVRREIRTVPDSALAGEPQDAGRDAAPLRLRPENKRLT